MSQLLILFLKKIFKIKAKINPFKLVSKRILDNQTGFNILFYFLRKTVQVFPDKSQYLSSKNTNQTKMGKPKFSCEQIKIKVKIKKV